MRKRKWKTKRKKRKKRERHSDGCCDEEEAGKESK